MSESSAVNSFSPAGIEPPPNRVVATDAAATPPMTGCSQRVARAMLKDPCSPVGQRALSRSPAPTASTANQESVASVAAIELASGWRLSEDSELQWLLQRGQSKALDDRNRWRTVAFCGTKEGLLEVALPHHGCQPTDAALLRLKSLPEYYLPGALAQIDDTVIITGPQHRSQQSLRRPGREAAQ